MTDDIWKRQEIASPCVKVCVIHPQTRLCTGCGRSIEEIGGWSQMTADERDTIMAELPLRMAAPKVRQGGRQGRRDRGPG